MRLVKLVSASALARSHSPTQCRQNQDLEQDSFALHEQQLRLQEEAQSLTQRLEVILHDKFQHRKHGFDSDTPIDKTLTFLQGVIGVRPSPVMLANSQPVMLACALTWRQVLPASSWAVVCLIPKSVD